MAGAIKALVRSEQNILAGFSFGANVIAEMLNYLPAPKGIALISPTIVGGNYTLNDTLKQGADPSVLFTDEPKQGAITAYIHKAILSRKQKDFSTCLEDFNAVKKPFRSMILKTAIEGKLTNEILNLTETGLPLFIAFGKEDSFVNPNYLDDANLILWNDGIHKIDDAGHFLHLDEPAIFNKLLAGYCKAMI
jgi:pimeloyl-ACP methyl ester carboxylesterase